MVMTEEENIFFKYSPAPHQFRETLHKKSGPYGPLSILQKECSYLRRNFEPTKRPSGPATRVASESMLRD